MELVRTFLARQNDGGWKIEHKCCEEDIRLALDRLSAYEETMSLERAQELSKADKDGRLTVLPCKDDAVYTIEENYFNCAECRNGSRARYQAEIDRVSCDMENGERCPYYIKEHEVEGFEISFDETGKAFLSAPGEFGYGGLEPFSGVDGKVYYTREEADAALERRINDGTAYGKNGSKRN